MNALLALVSLANGESCEDVADCNTSYNEWSCQSGTYSAWGTPYNNYPLHEVCPQTCHESLPDLTCLQWKYYPESPPAESNSPDESHCHEFVSQKSGVRNSDCAKICEPTDECIHQSVEPIDCYGSWMYGYDEEFDFIDDKAITDWTYAKRFENNFYFVKGLWTGATPADCQEECQKEEDCGYFAWRGVQADQQNSLVDRGDVPICVMKTRDTVVLANDEEVPLELYNHVASADIRWDWCNMNLTYE